MGTGHPIFKRDPNHIHPWSERWVHPLLNHGFWWVFNHGSLNVPIEHHPTIRYMVCNGYYKVMSNIPKMGQLPTPVNVRGMGFSEDFSWCLGCMINNTIGRDIFMGHRWILTLDTATTSNIKQSEIMGVSEVFDHSESVWTWDEQKVSTLVFAKRLSYWSLEGSHHNSKLSHFWGGYLSTINQVLWIPDWPCQIWGYEWWELEQRLTIPLGRSFVGELFAMYPDSGGITIHNYQRFVDIHDLLTQTFRRIGGFYARWIQCTSNIMLFFIKQPFWWKGATTGPELHMFDHVWGRDEWP